MTTVELVESMLKKAKANARCSRPGMTDAERDQLNLRVVALTQAVDCMRKCGLI